MRSYHVFNGILVLLCGIGLVSASDSDSGELPIFGSESGSPSDVSVFLCGLPGINDGRPVSATYGRGREFQFCVTPLDESHKVVGFESVICENQSHTRQLILDGQIHNPLTFVIEDIDGSRGLNEGEEAGANGMAVQSIVEADFLLRQEVFFQCRGIVELRDSNKIQITSAFATTVGLSNGLSPDQIIWADVGTIGKTWTKLLTVAGFLLISLFIVVIASWILRGAFVKSVGE